MNEQKGFFDGNPAMIFVFGLVAGIALTMVLGGVLPTFGGSGSIAGEEVAVKLTEDDNEIAPTRVLSPVTAEDHVRGDINSASVVIIEYSDFECPYCERHHPNMQTLYDAYEGDVAWIYRHFPLGFHPEAKPAALASECANEQGMFWEYGDALFANQALLGDDLYEELAGELGLDVVQFMDCYENETYADKVNSDYASGVAAGVTGTPATYINGEKISGAVPYETLQAVVESYLDK